MREKIRGFIGEQSFEITDGSKHLERLCEAYVFGAAYRAEREAKSFAIEARDAAMSAVEAFRRTRNENS